MSGLDQTLLLRLRQLLLKCDEFHSPRWLSTVMGTAELSPWQAGLPGADAVGARVDLTIHYLSDKRNVNGESALVLLLQILAGNYALQDERHQALLDLADELCGGRRTGVQSSVVPQEWRADQKTRNTMLDVLQKHINPAGLRALVFKVLGTGAYDDLPGHTHTERCISFLEEVERREKGSELVAELAATYPNIRF